MRCRTSWRGWGIEDSEAFFVPVDFGVVLAGAGGAKAVGEFGVGVLVNVNLNLLPEAGVVPDAFAMGADGEDAAEGLDFGEGLFEAQAGFDFVGEGEKLAALPAVEFAGDDGAEEIGDENAHEDGEGDRLVGPGVDVDAEDDEAEADDAGRDNLQPHRQGDDDVDEQNGEDVDDGVVGVGGGAGGGYIHDEEGGGGVPAENHAVELPGLDVVVQAEHDEERSDGKEDPHADEPEIAGAGAEEIVISDNKNHQDGNGEADGEADAARVVTNLPIAVGLLRVRVGKTAPKANGGVFLHEATGQQ